MLPPKASGFASKMASIVWLMVRRLSGRTRVAQLQSVSPRRTMYSPLAFVSYGLSSTGGAESELNVGAGWRDVGAGCGAGAGICGAGWRSIRALSLGVLRRGAVTVRSCCTNGGA